MRAWLLVGFVSDRLSNQLFRLLDNGGGICSPRGYGRAETDEGVRLWGFWPAIVIGLPVGLHDRSAVRLFLVQTASRLRAMLAAGR